MVFRTECIGLFCLALVYVSFVYADYVVVSWILIEHFLESVWFAVHLIFFNLLLLLMISCHARCVFTDPGIIPKPKISVDFSDRITREQFSRPGWTICTKCDMYRPPRAHHCGTCKRCIRKMDHHCPWVNNCVGECNQKFFLLFLFYTNMATLYAVVLLMAAWVLEANKSEPSSTDHRESLVLHSVILAVECILYFTFSVAIGCDQLTAILSQKSQIDRMKEHVPSPNTRVPSTDAENPAEDDDEHDPKPMNNNNNNRTIPSSSRRRTNRELFEDVFGDEPLWKWFLPTSSKAANRRSESDESSEFLL